MGVLLEEDMRSIAKIMLDKKYAQLEELYLEIEMYEYIVLHPDMDDSLKDILDAVNVK